MNTIQFPGLWGLKFNIDPVAFSIGSISIYWYGIIIATALMVSVLLTMKDSSRYGIEQDNVIDLILWAAPISVVFARLYYVVFKWSDYRDNPREIINIRHGGIAIYGAVIGAVLVAYIFSRVKRINTLNLFDLAAPYLVLAQSIGRWGNFVNQEAFGTNTTLPWGMTSARIQSELAYLRDQGMMVNPSIPVHPTFLYESLWNIGAFFILLWFRKRRKFEGEVFSMYMVVYGLGRFWIEGLRTDSLMLGNLRISQVLALLFAIGFAVLIFVRRRRASETVDAEAVEIGKSEYGSVLNKLKEEEANMPNEGDTASRNANNAAEEQKDRSDI